MNSTFHHHPDFTHAGIIWKHTEIIRKFTRYLKVLNFAIFAQVLIIFALFCTRENVQNNKIAKLSICRIWDSLFPHTLSKYDTDTLISHISTYSNKIRVSVTHLITITLINYRKNWYSMRLSFLISTEIAKSNAREMFWNHQIAKHSRKARYGHKPDLQWYSFVCTVGAVSKYLSIRLEYIVSCC